MPPVEIINLMSKDDESHLIVEPFKKDDDKETEEILDDADEAKYQKKKMLASGMMDLALLSANANQLRHILQSPHHSFYLFSLALVSSSLIIQLAVGILLIVNTNYTSPRKGEVRCKVSNIINNAITGGVMFISAINVFISAFGVSVTDENLSDHHSKTQN